MLNTLPPCLTAAAGTEFARDFIIKLLLHFIINKGFNNLPSLKKVHFVQYLKQKCSIRQFAYCKRFPTAATKVDRPCFSPIVAFLPLRKAMDPWLGTLLLSQLPNPY